MDFVPLLILMVFVANSSGLLTIVGDPATYIVGDSINITFMEYLQRLSLGGALAVITILLMLPWLFPKIWRTKFVHLEDLPHPQINHPRVLALGGIIVFLVLFLFVVGESFPVPIAPAAVALMGATLALLLAQQSKIDTVHNILRDVDWSTLLFFMSIFVLIGGLEKTGVVNSLSGFLAIILGKNIFLGSLVLLFFVGFISSVVPNIPLVVAMVPLLKQLRLAETEKYAHVTYFFDGGLEHSRTGPRCETPNPRRCPKRPQYNLGFNCLHPRAAKTDTNYAESKVHSGDPVESDASKYSPNSED